MDDATIIDFTGRDAVTDPLTDLLRKGARELLQAAVEAERDAFLAAFAERRTSDGRAAVVGNGYHPERAVQHHCPVGSFPADKMPKGGIGPALCSKGKIYRSGAALALLEGHFFG